MRELDQIVLQKGLFAPIKEHLCSTKGNLDNLQRQAELEFLLIGSYI